MKVLTMGDPTRLNPLMYFTCRRCGCEFVANALECHEEQDQYNESTMNPTSQWYFVALTNCKHFYLALMTIINLRFSEGSLKQNSKS